MADNTLQAGTDTIATDDVTTLNGAASSGIKVQRTKTTYGDDGTSRDVSVMFPLPSGNDTSASGTFTAADAVVAPPDGAGTLVSGTSTAGSVVPLQLPAGVASSVWLIKGLAANQTALTVYFEASSNTTNGTDGDWTEVKGRRTGTAVGVESTDYKWQTNGYYRGNPSGFTWVRARLVGTFTGTPSVLIRASTAQGATFLNSGLVSSSSTIGNVGPAPASTGTISSPALALTSFTVLAANTARKMAAVYNDSANTLYLALAATASTTAYTVQVPAGGYYELPGTTMIYTGIVTGIATTATGNARVTELS